MIIKSKIVTILVAFLIMGIILHLVRRRKLKEQYALLWIAMAWVGIISAAWRSLLFACSHWVGIAEPANFFFLVTLLFLIGILVHFSVAISVATERTRILGQELALVRWEKQQLEDRLIEIEKRL